LLPWSWWRSLGHWAISAIGNLSDKPSPRAEKIAA
jgi:hypothetical protein